jgi:hypothetical protein
MAPAHWISIPCNDGIIQSKDGAMHAERRKDSERQPASDVRKSALEGIRSLPNTSSLHSI